MRNSKKKSFDWYGMRQHFSIRKYHFGAASVLLGMSLALGAGAQVAQAEEAVASSEVTTVTIASSTDSSASSEVVATEATVASTTETPVSAVETATSSSTETATSTTETVEAVVTIEGQTVTSAERIATINYIVQYVLEDGTLVKADVKTASVTTTEATATSTVVVATELPLGYELATGQAENVAQEVTENGENIVTVKVVKKAEEKAAITSEETSSALTTATEEAPAPVTATEVTTTPETATFTETVKTPATVEEAKVVLEQVTSEAEVLANKAERLVAASDNDNTALKASAVATKLTATEATAVLNDSAATLESVKAQIDAVRTNVEALVLELRKFLGTDTIEIALTTVTDLNDATNRPGYWTENEEVLNKEAATATATTKPQEQRIPAGYAVDPTDGRITFLIYSLSADDVDAGKAAGTKDGSYNLRYGTDYYITLSMDRTPSDGVIYARLVSKQNGFIEEVAIAENTSRHQFQAIANGPKNLGSFTYRMSLTTMPFTDSTGQQTSVRYVNINSGQGGNAKGSVAYSLLTPDTTSYNSYTGLAPSYLPTQITGYFVKETERRSQELLASYAHVALVSGDSFTISEAAEFANYELIEAPAIKDTPVSTNYSVGTPLIQYFPERKTARVIYITKEDGTARFVNFMLNPDHPDFLENFKNYHSMSPVDFVTNGGAEALDFSSRIAIIDKYLAEIDAVKADTSLSSDQQASRLAELRANYATEINTDDNKFLMTFVSTEAEPLTANDGPDAVTGLTTWSHTVKNYYTNSNGDSTIALTIAANLNDPMVDWRPAAPTPNGVLLHSKTEVNAQGTPKRLTIPVDGTTQFGDVHTNIIAMFNMLTANENNQHYYYAEKGGVKVYYVDTAGTELKDPQFVYEHADTNTAYDTKSKLVDKIEKVGTDGTTSVYYYKEIDTAALKPASQNTNTEKRSIVKITDEVGIVERDTLKELTYVYELAGSVNVNYVDVDGNKLSGTDGAGKVVAEKVADTVNAKTGTEYNTIIDNRPAKIVTADGKTYELAPAADYTVGTVEADHHLSVSNVTEVTGVHEATGSVASGITKEITFVYKEVTGKVIVNFKSIDGEPLQDPRTDTEEGSTGRDYNTEEEGEVPPTITKEGKTYKLVPNLKDGNPTGKVTPGTTEVTYYYQLVTGDVVVNYENTDGKVIAPQVVDVNDGNIGENYTTTDHKPEKIVEDGTGDVYYIKPVGTEVKTGDGLSGETGQIVEGTTQVTYIYEKAGNVKINYILDDAAGTPLQGSVMDEVNAKPGTSYNTTDEGDKPETISKDGKLYRLKEVKAGSAAENGETAKIVAGETLEVTYVYTEVKSDVIVKYYDTEGNLIAGTETNSQNTVTDTDDKSVGTLYNTDEDHRPETITSGNKVYYYKQVKDGSASPVGTVAATDTTVEYVYEKAGDVIVHYIKTDGTPISGVTNTGSVTASTVDDTVNGKPGSTYDTTDLKPTTITTDEGKTYELVPTATIGDESGKVESGVTKEVTYVYKEVKGSVVVNYISTTGEELQAQVVDTPESSTGTEYDTRDVRPKTITTKDGRTFKLVPKMTQGSEIGDVVPGVTEVTYVYEEVKGDVVVNYVNTDGKVIAPQVVDTKTTSTGTDYDTTDNKPNKIVNDETGDVYYYKEVKAGDNETGKVVEGTTEVTYVYEKAGNVVVNYTLADGTPIKDPVNDETNQKPGTEYNTTDNKPETITTTDGKVYKLVPTATIGNETGDVEAGKTINVTYIYEEVKSDVVVEYYDTEGNPISGTETGNATSVVDTEDASVGTVYNTDDKKPATIKAADGTVYYYKEAKDTSAPTTGKVAETTTTVQYVYEKAGNVVVNYITEDGAPLTGTTNTGATTASTVDDTKDGKPGSPYDTTDNKPTTITTADGKTYELVPASTVGDETGTVEAGVTKEVTYIYQEVKGKVIVNYVDENGNPISGITDAGTQTESTVEDAPESSTGTEYNTTDLRPNTITTADGKIYKLVPSAIPANETGKVVEGTTEVTYVYELLQGDVVVRYVDTEGNTIAKDVTDTKVSDTGTDYDTTDNKPEKIVNDETGDVFYYKEVKAGDNETGKVVEGTTEVTYVYEKAGNVVVNYTLADGTPIKDPVNDETNQKPGTEYNTTDNKPETITTTDGKVYKLVPTATIGNETGDVESGKTINVTYIYEEVKSDVVVEYYDTEGNPISGTETGNATSVVDTEDASVGTAYNTDDKKPATITAADGTVYYYKEVKDTSAPTTGKVAETTTTVQYVYEKAGSVTVNYVTTDGTPIKDSVKDEENAEPGKTYSTEDNKPETITTEDGKTYKLVPNATTGEENGTITSGEDKQVTYVYEEVKGSVVVNYIDTEGKVIKAPVTDTPSSSTGTAYDTTDNKPTTITTEDGTTYELVPVLTRGSETGKVVEGETVVTYVYRKVVTKHVDEDGNIINPQEDGTTPNKGTSIPGYVYVKTITDSDGNTTHIYRKIPTNPTTPVTPNPGCPVSPTPGKPVTPSPDKPGTPVTPEPGKPGTPATPATPAKPATPAAGQAQLPNTGEASSSVTVLGAAMLVAALALVGKRRRNNED